MICFWLMVVSIERAGVVKSKPAASFAVVPEERNQSGSVSSPTMDIVGIDINMNRQRYTQLNKAVANLVACAKPIGVGLIDGGGK